MIILDNLYHGWGAATAPQIDYVLSNLREEDSKEVAWAYGAVMQASDDIRAITCHAPDGEPMALVGFNTSQSNTHFHPWVLATNLADRFPRMWAHDIPHMNTQWLNFLKRVMVEKQQPLTVTNYVLTSATKTHRWLEKIGYTVLNSSPILRHGQYCYPFLRGIY